MRGRGEVDCLCASHLTSKHHAPMSCAGRQRGRVQVSSHGPRPVRRLLVARARLVQEAVRAAVANHRRRRMSGRTIAASSQTLCSLAPDGPHSLVRLLWKGGILASQHNNTTKQPGREPEGRKRSGQQCYEPRDDTDRQTHHREPPGSHASVRSPVALPMSTCPVTQPSSGSTLVYYTYQR